MVVAPRLGYSPLYTCCQDVSGGDFACTPFFVISLLPASMPNWFGADLLMDLLATFERRLDLGFAGMAGSGCQVLV